MAVAARGRVWIPRQDRFPVNTFSEAVVGMAGSACLDHSDLIPFPWGQFMDVFMAVFALNLIDKMGTRIMFCPFLLVTAMTGNRLSMNLPPFRFPMGFHIRDIPVATVAGIGSVNGLGKLPLTDFGMATEAFGIIDTLITIFSALNDKPVSLFCFFGRFGDPCGFRTLLF